jgi:hypothetical protein
MRTVALLTPTYAADIERFDLLCESMDRYVTGYERHYVIVNDDDLPVFQKYASDRRVIAPSSAYLPSWLWAVPRFLAFKGRRIWVSPIVKPVHGWHVQQILKIAGALNAAEDRTCLVDSDNLFFREFNVQAYAGLEKTPLYLSRGALSGSEPKHTLWTRNAFRLLGLPEPLFPADDYVGNVIAWDKEALKSMTEEIRLATGLNWQLALCRTRRFSEYMLYGQFIAHAPRFREQHEIVEKSLACAYWDEEQLDEAWVRDMLESAEPQMVALCIQSYSHTSVPDIRSAMQFARAA